MLFHDITSPLPLRLTLMWQETRKSGAILPGRIFKKRSSLQHFPVTLVYSEPRSLRGTNLKSVIVEDALHYYTVLDGFWCKIFPNPVTGQGVRKSNLLNFDEVSRNLRTRVVLRNELGEPTSFNIAPNIAPIVDSHFVCWADPVSPHEIKSMGYDINTLLWIDGLLRQLDYHCFLFVNSNTGRSEDLYHMQLVMGEEPNVFQFLASSIPSPGAGIIDIQKGRDWYLGGILLRYPEDLPVEKRNKLFLEFHNRIVEYGSDVKCNFVARKNKKGIEILFVVHGSSPVKLLIRGSLVTVAGIESAGYFPLDNLEYFHEPGKISLEYS